MPELIREDDDGPVRRLVLSRPEKRNALSMALYRELGEAICRVRDDAAIRAVVISGDGPMFSAGNDVTELRLAIEDATLVRSSRTTMLGAFTAIETLPKPVIAQIHGACIGGACELALACDFRVIAEDAIIGLFETKLGVIPDLGGCSRLPAVVGLGRAKEMVMAARALTGLEALSAGLATRAAPGAALDEVVAELVDALLANGPRAVGLAKRVLDAAAKPALEVSLELEVTAQELLMGTDDFREGVDAVAERRQPVFTGA